MSTSKTNTPTPSQEDIALHAYFAWEKDGRPNGRHIQYWLAAEAALRPPQPKPATHAAPKVAAVPARGIKPKSVAKPATNGHRKVTPAPTKAAAKTARSVKPSAPRRKA